MQKAIEQAQGLIDFIHQSPTMFHVAHRMAEKLKAQGFEPLCLKHKWNLKPGGKYYTTKNGSAIFAFTLGGTNPADEGFRFLTAHSDSPGFRIKPSAEMKAEGRLLKLNTEVYGGPILMTWLDRPLSLAGRVILRSDNPLHPKKTLVDLKKPIAVIPSLAIHLNRAVNEGVELNKQKDMLPLLGTLDGDADIENLILKEVAGQLNVQPDDIIDFDLFVYDVEKGMVCGIHQNLIFSPKLDDLAMAYPAMEALMEAKEASRFNMTCIFDNEEVGSGTKQGAASPVLKHILQRIADSYGLSQEDYQRMLYHSFMISADMAHSVHPNQPEKHDPTNRPLLNGGPVIKLHAGQKYMTDADSSAVFESICKLAGVPYQKFVNRSDQMGGSTLGNILTSQLDIRGVDIGNPMLAMHSARETGGVLDLHYVMQAFKTFYTH